MAKNIKDYYKKIKNNKLLLISATSLSIKIIYSLTSFLTNIILARNLTSESFGIYSISISSVNIITQISSLGLPILAVKQIPEYIYQENYHKLKGFIKFSQLSTITSSIILSFTISAFLLYTKTINITIFYFLIIATPISVINALRAGFLRGLNHIILADTPDMIVKPLILLTLATLCSLTTLKQHKYWELYILAISFFITMTFGLHVFKKSLPKKISYTQAHYEKDTWIKNASLFLVVSIITALESQIALILLGKLGTTSEAALYQASCQLVSPLSFGIVAVNTTIQPKIASLWAQNDTKKAQKIVHDATKIGSFIAFFALAIILLFSDSILNIYGKTYIDASLSLKIIAIGQFINACAGPCGTVLAMTGNQKIIIRGIFISLCINFLICAILIPYYGHLGAAIASTTALITWNIYLSFMSFKITNIKTYIFGF